MALQTNSLLGFLSTSHHEFSTTRDLFSVLASIIRYAGPSRLLQLFFKHHFHLWPQTSYAASEAGWGGQFRNISSNLDGDAKNLRLTYNKSFILSAHHVIFLAQQGSKPTLVLVPFSAIQGLQAITSPEMQWPTNTGVIQHFRAVGQISVRSSDVVVPRRRDFLVQSAYIPLIETIGFVCLLLWYRGKESDLKGFEQIKKALQESEKEAYNLAKALFVQIADSIDFDESRYGAAQHLMAFYRKLILQ